MRTGPRWLRTLRLVAGFVAIASALPYLALKLIWLGGGRLGVADFRMMQEPSMTVLNAVTAGMDVVGILLAVAFTSQWGRRIPAWLLLPPMWVASGLLTTFVIWVPIVALLSQLIRDSLPAISGGPVDGWVYGLVYLEFAGLGAGLMTAFVLHATIRWPGVFQPWAQDLDSSTTHPVLVILSNAAAPIAIVLGGLYLGWAFGATVGLPDAAAARRTTIGSVFYGVDAVLMIAAAAGTFMITHRTGQTAPPWLPVSMAWIGTGAMFGWGLWQTINVLGETALVRTAQGRGFVNLIGLLRLVIGLVLGLVMLVALAERRSPVRSAAMDHPAARTDPP